METNTTQTTTLGQVITAEQAVKLEKLVKYEPIINILINAGVFDAKNAQVVMDFNALGDLMSIKTTIKSYTRGKLPL